MKNLSVRHSYFIICSMLFSFMIYSSYAQDDLDDLFKDEPKVKKTVKKAPKDTGPKGNLENGKKLFQSCIACHGPQAQGNPALKSPPLAGQQSWYLELSIKKFQNGIRGADPVKEPQAALMAAGIKQFLKSEQDIKDVVAYIKTIETKPVIHNLAKGNASLGKNFFSRVCSQCHGDNAQGIAPTGYIGDKGHAPALNILPDWYISRQIKKFQKGIRGKHPEDTSGKHMLGMSKLLSNDSSLQGVIEYIKAFNKK